MARFCEQLLIVRASKGRAGRQSPDPPLGSWAPACLGLGAGLWRSTEQDQELLTALSLAGVGVLCLCPPTPREGVGPGQPGEGEPLARASKGQWALVSEPFPRSRLYPRIPQRPHS